MIESPSQAEFARSLGVSRAAISKAAKQGRVILDAQGRVNLIDPRTIDYRDRLSENREHPPRPRKTSVTAIPISPPSPLSQSPESIDYNDSKARKAKSDADKAELTVEIMRGKYILRDLVHKYNARLFAVDSVEITSIGDRKAAEVAAVARRASTMEEAELLVNKLMTEESWRTIRHIKRIMDDFEKHEADNPGPVIEESDDN